MLWRLPKPEAGRPLNPLHTHPVWIPPNGRGRRGSGRLTGPDRLPCTPSLFIQIFKGVRR